MFCGQCGNNVSDSAKFCPKCGWKVQGGNNTPTPSFDQQGMKKLAQGNAVNIAPVASATAVAATEKAKKKSKLWLWLLLIVLVLGLGAGGTWAYFTYFASEEEGEDEEDDRDDEDDDEGYGNSQEPGGLAGAYIEYVEKSQTTVDMSLIWNAMNALEILAADPSIAWNGEVVYVKFTADGMECGSENETVISEMKAIMGGDNAVVQWKGFELWAKKEESGRVSFATSWDYDEMAYISPSFADRFSMTSVEP